MSYTHKDLKDTLLGVAFLTPNICGFLAFTLVPLVISLFMAFTNWDLEMHNVFRDTSVKFVGLENFRRLFSEPDFARYLGNTLFFMMGIPFGVGGSLCAALLLSSDFKGGNRRIWIAVVASVVMIIGCGTLVLGGMGATAMTIVICGLAGAVMLGGSLGGQTVYRTLFYFPHFTAGVATFILWKKLYSPETGPVNYALRPVLDRLAPVFAGVPPTVASGIALAMLLIVISLSLIGVRRNLSLWRDGESGTLSLVLGCLLLSLPLCLMWWWTRILGVRVVACAGLAAAVAAVARRLVKGRDFKCQPDRGLGDAVIFCGGMMAGSCMLLGLSSVVYALPQMAADGLEPPGWISDYYWAKPSLMIMGLWAAVGSNNMLLYLAGLSGIPPELYEAADIDGAGPLQRFWNITWPQLSNITFFVLIMAVINGLQGGFEMARTMTQGGPFRATTTLSYYVYSEGFETGRLGYASAVSWALFLLVLSVTLFNWKFGNRYTSD